MNTRVGNEMPIRIGPAALFGWYHPSPRPETPGAAVLLCPPIGQDQIRSHRLYRRLAHALVAEGHAVLRYDCYGTGDSPGASREVDWQRCIADTATAADDLRRRSGHAQVVGFGARLGGSLALAAAAAAGLSRLIVWDAVLDGAAHVAQLDDWQERLRQDADRFTQPRPAADASGQWLGFAVSPTLRAQIGALTAAPAALPTLLVQSAGTLEDRGAQVLLAAGARRAALAAPSPWIDFRRLETTVLAPEMIRVVCAHLRETA